MSLNDAIEQLNDFLKQNPHLAAQQAIISTKLNTLPEGSRLPYIFEIMMDSRDEMGTAMEKACTPLKALETLITNLTSQTSRLK